MNNVPPTNRHDDPSIIYEGPLGPVVIHFNFDGQTLFSIHRDGTIEKGPGWTTEDEMSLKFWELVMENFNLAWWRGLVKRKTLGE